MPGVKLILPGSTLPAPTTGETIFKGSETVTPEEMRQMFANIKFAIDNIELGAGSGTGYAANQSEQDALVALGITDIIRTDLLGVLEPAETVAPVVVTFTIPATSNTLLVTGITLTATDAVGVTGYRLSESATTPNQYTAGWVASSPTEFTFAEAGAKTLYAWAKDAAGNISAVATDTTVITLADATAPTISSFTMPSTATSLQVAVSTFTASDNVGVTGYLVTESATAPDLSNPGWVSSAPTTFTFSGTGARTAYAWARDAAGKISTAVSAACTITASDVMAPTVTVFTAPATSNSLTVSGISFTASDNVAVAKYLITESATAPSAGVFSLTSAPTSYVFASVGSKTLYPWALDTAGLVSAVFATPQSVTVTTAPNAITSPSVTNGEVGQCTITWTGSAADSTHSAATSYNLRWKLSTDGSYTTVTGVTSGYVKTGLTAGLAYNFIVDAINAGGTTAQAAGNGVPLALPTTPVITAAAASTTTILISLTSGGSGAVSYDVKWGTSAGSRTNTESGVTLPYTHTGRTAGVPYYYSLVATNTAGSSESTEQTATIVDVFSGMTQTITDDFNRASIGANWQAVSGLASLTISGSTKIIAGTSAYQGMNWNADVAADQYAQCDTINVSTYAGSSVMVTVRASAAADTAYLGYLLYGATNDTLSIIRVVAGAYVHLADVDVPHGTVTGMRLGIKGTSLELMKYSSAAWSTALTATDSTLTTGRVGLRAYLYGQCDNFAAGTL